MGLALCIQSAPWLPRKPLQTVCCVTVAIRRPHGRAGCFCGLVPSACLAVGSGAAGVHKRMSQQPESTSSTLAVSPAPLPGQAVEAVPADLPQPDRPVPQRIPRWLERIELLLRVMLRMYIGLAVCYAPWSRVFWDQNPLFLAVSHAGRSGCQWRGARNHLGTRAAESVGCAPGHSRPPGDET